MAKKTTITPLADRVILKPLSAEDLTTKTDSGIIIPDTVNQEKPEQGTVIAVGEGKCTESGERIPISVSVGDRVVFSKYGFDEVVIDDVEYYIVKEESILAIIEK